ncbi:putative RNA-binding Zn ribbon-like protein [Chitinophaga dinghuensis]|uniref:Putative RNA-binding Zn ribbon-like protein n=1 Tax=Chitinophaga dinghuensis TaxID=1539050 RepID=A0A327VTT6_9BACT|nr:CGNR zinc finger domain-containing protein [Chitinophaga dinghuensis]RAJ79299.1 putative RNA-binding Zn ribbon-like protein [Chitinophaga dinghuensis]
MDSQSSISDLRLTGGDLCLDFINTVPHRFKPEEGDYLQSFRDITAWYHHIQGMTPKTIQTLDRLAKSYPQKAAQVFTKSIQLRELLYQICLQVTTGKAPAPHDLITLSTYIAEAYTNMELSWQKEQGRLQLQFNAPALEQVNWHIAQHALQLLTNGPLKQVKQCPGCGWIFLDKSKNSSRRWCSMATCGDIDKVTRFQQRNKKRK